MPRVNLAGDVYKDKDLVSLIKRYKYGSDMTNAEAAKAVGICEATWTNYMAEPGRIPLKVLRKMRKAFRIPKEEMLPFLV